ncbi:unnamed protein product [Linum trigynum]|uniref:Retrotransposon gag domain-containing protein n=1 Tax=Linum trigynum TaxID=586398 RepID=A0AAV2FU66_9ROSI
MCDTMKNLGVSNDAICLMMFSSLLRCVAHWFQNLALRSITTWAQLEKAFLGKYFPPAKAIKRQKEIVEFEQADDEGLNIEA